MKKTVGAIIALVVFIHAAVDFVQVPTADVVQGKVIISFSVSMSTDAEVRILDSQDRVVRHLAAGVLGGEKAVPAPLQPGLSQALEWDGNDDFGKPAVNGPFKVRIRLGILPEYSHVISTKSIPGDHWSLPVNQPGEFLKTDHPLITGKLLADPHQPSKLNFCADDVTDEVLIKSWGRYDYSPDLHCFNGITGMSLNKIISTKFSFNRAQWGEPALSLDGQYIYHSSGYHGTYRTFRATGAPAPWPAINSHGIDSNVYQIWHSFQHSRGLCEGKDGSLYILHHGTHRSSNTVYVTRIAPDGSMGQERFIRIDASGSGGIRVDLKGNVFIGAHIKPLNQPVPSDLSGKLETSGGEVSQAWWAREMYGSVLKFGPSGGQIIRSTTGSVDLGNYNKAPGTLGAVSGMEWMHYGLSHVVTHSGYPAYGAGCVCNVVRFDVDRDGRVILPDAFRYSFVILDNNGNMIRRVTRSEITNAFNIPFGLGHQVEVTDQYLYIGDQFNNNIIAMKLNAEKEAQASLPTGIENEFQISQASGIRVYPNPFNVNTMINIECRISNVECRSLELDIFNLNGQLIKRKTFVIRHSSFDIHYSFDWHAGHLPRGIYIVKVKKNRKVYAKRILLGR